MKRVRLTPLGRHALTEQTYEFGWWPAMVVFCWGRMRSYCTNNSGTRDAHDFINAFRELFN